jgi:hypothetical protein
VARTLEHVAERSLPYDIALDRRRRGCTGSKVHNGPLVLLRMYMLHAEPRHQRLICAVFVLAGVALLTVLGQLSGVVLIVFGVALARPILKARTPSPTPPERHG